MKTDITEQPTLHTPAAHRQFMMPRITSDDVMRKLAISEHETVYLPVITPQEQQWRDYLSWLFGAFIMTLLMIAGLFVGAKLIGG